MAVQNLTRRLLDAPLERGLGGAIAIREPKRAWSYARLAEEACRAGSALRALGVRPGARVALFLNDSADASAAFLGAMRIGAVPTPINTLLRPLELRALLRDAGAGVVIAGADLSSTIDAIRGELPELEQVLAIGGARPGQRDFHALTRAAEVECAPVDPEDARAPAFLLYSAGAVTTPRGVPHTHEAALHAHAAYGTGLISLSERDRVFCTAKLWSAYGLGLGLLFPLLAGASTVLLPSRPRPRTIFDVMVAYRPTVFAATPSLYGQMVHDYEALAAPRPECFGAVRHAVSGGEALPGPLERRIGQAFGVQVLHGFGTTEALHFVFSNHPAARRAGSVGRVLHGIEARVVGDDGLPLAKEEIGLLELRGPTVAVGYFGSAAGGAFHDGWVRPGDRFFVDQDGYYYYCGRVDDLFKVSGRWVAPEEVERALLAHPAVWECAVVEGHDDVGLARPVAYVVPNVGHEPSQSLALQLMEFVKSEIAPYKYPREVAFVNALPKGQSGEVLRWRLRQAQGEPRGSIRPR
jgi:benzoate-CoA ligase